jgi:hypothetical protein
MKSAGSFFLTGATGGYFQSKTVSASRYFQALPFLVRGVVRPR